MSVAGQPKARIAPWGQRSVVHAASVGAHLTIVMITTGGTGGHVFPGLAVAAKLAARGARVFWLGTREGIEAKLVPQHGVDFEGVSFRGVRGKGLRTLAARPVRAACAHASTRARSSAAACPTSCSASAASRRFPAGSWAPPPASRWCCTTRTPSRDSPRACSRTAPTDPAGLPAGAARRACEARRVGRQSDARCDLRTAPRRASALPGAADRCACSSSAAASARKATQRPRAGRARAS